MRRFLTLDECRFHKCTTKILKSGIRLLPLSGHHSPKSTLHLHLSCFLPWGRYLSRHLWNHVSHQSLNHPSSRRADSRSQPSSMSGCTQHVFRILFAHWQTFNLWKHISTLHGVFRTSCNHTADIPWKTAAPAKYSYQSSGCISKNNKWWERWFSRHQLETQPPRPDHNWLIVGITEQFQSKSKPADEVHWLAPFNNFNM